MAVLTEDAHLLDSNVVLGSSTDHVTTYYLHNVTALLDASGTNNHSFNAVNQSVIYPMDGSEPAFYRDCLTYDFVMEAVLMGILCVFGSIGNVLSIICLWRDKSKTATPTLLISLQVADNLFLLSVFTIRVFPSISQYFRLPFILPFIPYMGKYIFPASLVAQTGTIYLTLLVTFNRYVSVCQPYEASALCSPHYARRHVALVWLFSALYNCPRFFEYQIGTMVDPATNMTFKVHQLSPMALNSVYQIVYSNLLYFLIMFLIPLITVTILNSNLIAALKRTKRKRKQLKCNNSTLKSSTNSCMAKTHRDRSEDDITLILIVTVLVFVICQTPALITQLLISLLPDSHKRCPSLFFYYERVSDLMVVVNSSINFLIYCFCSLRFRQILLNLIGFNRVWSLRKVSGARDGATVVVVPEENTVIGNGHTVIANGSTGRKHFLRAPKSITKYTTIHPSPKALRHSDTLC